MITRLFEKMKNIMIQNMKFSIKDFFDKCDQHINRRNP